MRRMKNRTRLNSLVDRVRAIEIMLTNREEEVERESLEEWKKQKETKLGMLQEVYNKQIEEKKEMNCCEPICRGKLLLRRYHNRGAFLNLGEKNPQLVAAIYKLFLNHVPSCSIQTNTQTISKHQISLFSLNSSIHSVFSCLVAPFTVRIVTKSSSVPSGMLSINPLFLTHISWNEAAK